MNLLTEDPDDLLEDQQIRSKRREDFDHIRIDAVTDQVSSGDAPDGKQGTGGSGAGAAAPSRDAAGD